MRISRRQALTALGLGAGSLCLPSLAGARSSAGAPHRFVLFYTAQGTVPSRWVANPEGKPEGRNWTSSMAGWSESDFSDILRPLHPYRQRISVVDGLGLVSAEADGFGARHERAQAHSLTGANAAWVGGFPFAGAPTIDQILAGHLARADRYPSIEVSIGGGLAYDGYGSVVYRARQQPVPAIDDPRLLWDRLFATKDASMSDPVLVHQGSVLDAIAERYAAVAPRLSMEDRATLDSHRQLLRALEQRVQGLNSATCGQAGARPQGHGDYDEDFSEQLAMIIASLACDFTRVASLQMGQLTPAQLKTPPGDVHGDYAHAIYESREAEDVMTEYGRIHAEQFARILQALERVPEAGGTMLDHTTVLWMSEMADSWHGFDQYPVVVAGGDAGLRMGQWIHYAPTTPFEGLHFHPRPRMGVPHQKLLTSILRSQGVAVDHMPVAEIRGTDGRMIDCRGVLPELMA